TQTAAGCFASSSRDLIRYPITVTATQSAFAVADTTPPVLIGGAADRTVEPTGSAGAVVKYDVPLGDDAVSGSVPVVCSPASGSTFPVGTTTVSCRASDSRGNVATESFHVTVVD